MARARNHFLYSKNNKSSILSKKGGGSKFQEKNFKQLSFSHQQSRHKLIKSEKHEGNLFSLTEHSVSHYIILSGKDRFFLTMHAKFSSASDLVQSSGLEKTQWKQEKSTKNCKISVWDSTDNGFTLVLLCALKTTTKNVELFS